jgi:hypothetical protein
MKHRSNGLVGYTAEEIKNWIARYHSSGMSLRSFAQEHGLKWSRLHYWLYQKHRTNSLPGRSRRGSRASSFGELKLPDFLPGQRWAAEIALPSGTSVRLASEPSAAWIAALVKELHRSC